jgi:hypothetical protein
MSRQLGIAPCPRCNRAVGTNGNRFKPHATVRLGDEICRMSDQHVFVSGHSSRDYIARAHVIADLADQVQDRDPALVWDYLTALPTEEVQRLLVIALAAVPVDKPVHDVWAWVCDLPAAKAVSA